MLWSAFKISKKNISSYYIGALNRKLSPIISKKMKRILLILIFLLSGGQLFAQGPSQGFLEYMNGIQQLIQNDLYNKVSAVLYDVEETPKQSVFLDFCKNVEKDFHTHYSKYADKLSSEEKDAAAKFTQTMMIQLGELYLDRAQELEVSERLVFFRTFMMEMGYAQNLSSLNEDVSRAIIMGIYSAMNIPFGMPTQEVVAYIYKEEEPIKELYHAAFIINEMAMLNESYDELEAMSAGFQKEYPSSRFLSGLDATLASLENLREGALVQDFSFVDQEGKERKLSEFKDKIIYLDLWASWCGPCINTFKTKTPDFEKKLRNREDVVLMYISIDEKPESWKNYLDKNPMRGIHLFAGRGFEADIMKYFKVWGIPRYLIIGKENKLISPNAPRPGDEAYEALIGLN
ncbi:thioredoxin-like protein [Cecembia rubra]|uniref:Thioredoxin-like protein n=2 Tax=Cecembia rubra TaxID=1485585 RepID=A0A2P8DTD6_9BACT|nr:thioredoxin-like protein [Cecembia rubra]